MHGSGLKYIQRCVCHHGDGGHGNHYHGDGGREYSKVSPLHVVQHVPTACSTTRPHRM